MGYKPELAKSVEESDIGKMIHRPKKLRINTEFPIILNEVFYPSDLNNQLFISAKAEVYLETSYIHLGERTYEEAYAHYSKAKANTESKSPLTEFYYHLHAAQIFESAGRDEIALSFYHRAKCIIFNLFRVVVSAKLG
jgi:tetratricopeptide (TPR) repeat protein